MDSSQLLNNEHITHMFVLHHIGINVHSLLMTRYMKNNTIAALSDKAFKNAKQLKELNHIHSSLLLSHLMICLTWHWIPHHSKVSHQDYSMVLENSFHSLISWFIQDYQIHPQLSIKSNNFTSIPSNLFNSLTLLNTLFVTIHLTLQQTTSSHHSFPHRHLDSNSIKSLDSKMFNSLRNLKELSHHNSFVGLIWF